jgi:hypothetical protein
MTSKSTSKIALCAFVIGFSLSASTSAFAQYNPNIHNNAGNGMMDIAAPYNPAPYNPVAATGTGYTNDGTLMMGGQKIGNPHQILHDLNVPSFFGVNANRLTFTDNPSYGSGTLAQMENHTLTIGVPAGNVVLSRLYVTPTNPYTEGVATPHNNYQTYQGVVADAQAGSYQLTVANDNKLYAFKTLGTMSTQSQNILIKELPAHSVFIANSDPKGGATAVRVTQSGDYAAMQNYFDTVKPYDFGWRSAFGVYANDPNSASFVANWVMGSHQVQAYQANLQNQSMQSGNEAFGVLAWDANQNRYVMLDPTNTKATSGSVSGNMPTLANNQFGFFGMHTHPGSATPSGQDLRMTQQLGLDQLVVGTNGTQAIFTNNPSNNWQGAGFEFEQTASLGFGGEVTKGKGGNYSAAVNIGKTPDGGLAISANGSLQYTFGFANSPFGFNAGYSPNGKVEPNFSYVPIASVNIYTPIGSASANTAFNDPSSFGVSGWKASATPGLPGYSKGVGFQWTSPSLPLMSPANMETLSSFLTSWSNTTYSPTTDSFTSGTYTDASGNISGTTTSDSKSN